MFVFNLRASRGRWGLVDLFEVSARLTLFLLYFYNTWLHFVQSGNTPRQYLRSTLWPALPDGPINVVL